MVPYIHKIKDLNTNFLGSQVLHQTKNAKSKYPHVSPVLQVYPNNFLIKGQIVNTLSLKSWCLLQVPNYAVTAQSCHRQCINKWARLFFSKTLF